MASHKSSYNAPLLTKETEFELLSESTKYKNNSKKSLELAYENAFNSHRQPQFNNAETAEISRRSNRSSTSAIYTNIPQDSNQFSIAMEENLIKNGIDINHHRQQASNSHSSSSHIVEFTHQNNRESIYNPQRIQSNNNSGYTNMEERIQSFGWCTWIILLFCCPMYCPFVVIWYIMTTCIRPRCFLIFSMCFHIVWIWIDEILDIVFIHIMYTSNYNAFIDDSHSMNFLFWFFISSICVNHFFNFFLSFVIRNNWCFDKNHYSQYMDIRTIPSFVKYFCLFFVGILSSNCFNTICKTFYLVKNRNNVGTIYMDQRFLCSKNGGTSSKSMQSSSDDVSVNGCRGQRWHHKLYEMEALSTKEMFNAMLEREAQIYPLLMLCQFVESIPKIIVFCTIVSWNDSFEEYPLIMIKLIMCVLSFVAQIKSCYISCANAEFIEQFNED